VEERKRSKLSDFLEKSFIFFYKLKNLYSLKVNNFMESSSNSSSQFTCKVNNEIDENYVELVRRMKGDLYYIEALIKLLQDMKLSKGKILLLGIEEGKSLKYMKQFLEKMEVFALDDSEELLGKAIDLNLGFRVNYELGDIEDIPYSSNEFNAVMFLKTVDSVDSERVLSEMLRVTDVSGKIGIIEWHPYYYSEQNSIYMRMSELINKTRERCCISYGINLMEKRGVLNTLSKAIHIENVSKFKRFNFWEKFYLYNLSSLNDDVGVEKGKEIDRRKLDLRFSLRTFVLSKTKLPE
jgi:ubiquinone/menaquinone biosynthesis C-methylase UbiE